MRKLYFLFGFLCSWFAANAQLGTLLNFEKGFGTPGNDEALAMCRTSDGGYVLTGRSNGFGSNYDVFTVKFDSAGHVVWHTSLALQGDDAAYGVQEAANGDILLAGNTRTSSGVTNSDVFLVRYSATGQLIWQNLYGSSAIDERCTELLVLPGGNVMLVGKIKNGLTYDGMIQITDSTGDLLSTKVYGIAGDEEFKDALLSIDNKVLLCSRSGTGVYRDVWLLKTDFNGDTLWTRTYATTMPGVEVGTLTQLNNGDIAVLGSENYSGSSLRSFHIATDSTGVELGRVSSGLIYDTPTDAAVMRGGGFVYGSGYVNFFNHFGLQMCTSILSTPGYWRFLESTVYEFGASQSGFATALISDTVSYFPDNIYVLAGSTRLSGYGQSDFALVRSIDAQTKSSSDQPVISAPGLYSGGATLVDNVNICKGDSVQLTLVSNKKVIQHWLRTNTAELNLSSGTSIWVKTSGMYLLVAQDADSNIWVSNFIKVNVIDSSISTVTASGPLSYCAAQGNTLSLSVNSSFSSSYQWYLNGVALPGQTSVSVNANQSGAYYCVMTNACVTDTSATKIVNTTAGPDPGWTWPNGGAIILHNLCDPSFNQQLSIPANQGSTITWYKDSVIIQNGGTSYTPNDTGYYWVVISNACDTVQNGPLHAIYYRIDEPALIAGTSNFCQGYGSATLQVVSQYNNPQPPFQWYRNSVPISGANNFTYTATIAGTYTVEYNDSICLFPQVSQPRVVGIAPPAVPNPLIITASDSLICGDSVVLSSPVVPGWTASQYEWKVYNSWAGTGPSITVVWGGVYRLIINNVCGDSVAASQNTITLNSYPAQPVVSATDDVLCSLNDSVQLSITNYNPNYHYEWYKDLSASPLDSAASVWVSQGGYYTCKSFVSGCTSGYGWSQIRDTLFCFGPVTNINCDTACTGSIILSPAGLPPYSYNWSNGVSGVGLNTLLNLCAGSYSVDVVDSAGCTGIRSFTIDQTLPVTASYSVVPPSPGACDGQLVVSPQSGTAPFVTTINPPLNPGLCDATSYTLSVSDSNGCLWSDNYFVVADQDSVWPGDANHDGIANNFDVLALGLGYGESGPVRQGANITWTPQFAVNWADTLFGTLDYKHIDTNGDGVINKSDTTAILQNYGFTHAKPTPVPASANPPVFVVLQDDSLGRSETDTAEIHIGDLVNSVTDLYGVAFRISFDPMLIQPQTVVVEPIDSWFADPDVSSIIFTASGNLQNGIVEIAMTRFDQIPRSGIGMVARLIYKTASTVPLAVNPSQWMVDNLLGYDNTGGVINLQGSSTAFTVYDAVTGIQNVVEQAAVQLEPNPTSGIVRVVSSGLDRFVVRSLYGQIVQTGTIQSQREYLDLSGEANGVYLFEGYNRNRKLRVMKIVLSR